MDSPFGFNGFPFTAGNMFVEGADRWMKLWSDVTQNCTAALQAVPTSEALSETARTVRSAVLKATADAWNDYLRSDAFAALLRQGLQNGTEMRRTWNEFFGRLHHELQGVSRQDIDTVMQTVQHLERRVADGFARLAAQLDALQSRPAASSAAAARPRPARAPKRNPRRRARARTRSRVIG